MASHGIRDRVAIVGMGCTPFGEHWDKSVDDLLLEASQAATKAAGVTINDIDAFWLGTAVSGMSGLTLSRPLRIQYKPVTRLENLCTTGAEAFRNACYAVASGAYDVAMAIGGEKLKDTGNSGLAGGGVPDAGDDSRWETSAPANYSALADGYAAKYDLSHDKMKDVLARIAWKSHQNGARNKLAQFRKEVPLETIRNAGQIAGLLGLYDCSGVADGAAAAIIVRAEDAHRYTDNPIYVKGLSFVAGPGTGFIDDAYDFTSVPEVVAAAKDAYQQAGITDPRRQLALAEVHDCFTSMELVLMEDLGFSKRGEGWKDVLAGAFDAGGELPINADGGLKAFGHPIGASGLRMMYECWLQLRREAPEDRQIAAAGRDRKLALTQNIGGAPGDCVSFVSVLGSALG